MKQYIVFWIKNGRIGSVEYTQENFDLAHKKMHLSLIQRDITGTIHYEILRVR